MEPIGAPGGVLVGDDGDGLAGSGLCANNLLVVDRRAHDARGNAPGKRFVMKGVRSSGMERINILLMPAVVCYGALGRGFVDDNGTDV